ncbi:MAG: HAD hydrolase-like protein [Desulfuromonadaceae bacterium]|nr:HAD hydrolase-like protein [Desulfuromonadaceae bacterium]
MPLLLPSFQAVIFDLDGTLIDSAPGILRSFEDVLRKTGIQPRMPLDESIIGPPLRQALINLTGVNIDTELDALVELFKDSYDTEGYRATRVYEGVEELLAHLADRKIPMAIATNKRKIPTLKILELLNWNQYFQAVGTLDGKLPPYPNKSALIGALLREMGVEASTSVYIGDKWEDGEAAVANNMPFIAAGWGYGKWDSSVIHADLDLIDSPRILLKKLTRCNVL